ncbi:ABC-type transport auxiliary lipoprotein family protein [Limimonas halophila]|nr:ABC-type transport auxiliary lipoprotein family protein [Limimonas halophila]
MRARFTLLALAAVLGLGGCVADPAPYDRYYPLTIGDAGRRYGQPLLAGTVEVTNLAAAGLTGDQAILYADGGGPALQQYSYHYWLEPPTVQVRDAVVTALRQSGAAERVITPETRSDARYRITGRLLELRHHRAGADSAVTVGVDLAVVRARDRTTLHVGTYSAREAVGSTDVGAAVEAAQKALTRITGRFLDDLAEAVRAQRRE